MFHILKKLLDLIIKSVKTTKCYYGVGRGHRVVAILGFWRDT